MKKTIRWRIKHAQRKISQGRKVSKFKRMLMMYNRMKQEEMRTGVTFVFRHGVKSDSMHIPAGYIKTGI